MAESRIKDDNYYQISGWMINRLKLKGVALSAYAIIYGFTQDGENEFTGSLQYLCDFCGGVSKPTIIKAMKELVEKNLVFKKEVFINGVQFNRYKVNLQAVNNFNEGSKDSLQGVVNNFNEGSKDSLHNNKSYNKASNNINIINNIIDHLNLKAGTKYKAGSKTTQQHIHARLAEGYTVEDFYTVIDKKCSGWLGTEFEQYLRPSTLFGTKFEAYLNEKVYAKKKVGSTGVEIIENADDDLDGIL